MSSSKRIVHRYIRRHRRMNVAMMQEALADQSDKTKYKVPRRFRFANKIQEKTYGMMPVFEVSPKKSYGYTLLYIHGGAYVHPFSVFHWRFMSKVSRRGGCGLEVPNYLKLPLFTYKKSHEQMMEFYKEFSSTHKMDKVIIAGDSAGGGFALSLLQQARDLNLPLPKKAILFSPWVDVVGGNPILDKYDCMIDYEVAQIPGKAWADNDDPHNPIISPLYGKMNDLCPVDIYVGTHEILFNDCVKTHELLYKSGNTGKLFVGNKMGHVYPLYPMKEARPILKHIINQLRLKH